MTTHATASHRASETAFTNALGKQLGFSAAQMENIPVTQNAINAIRGAVGGGNEGLSAGLFYTAACHADTSGTRVRSQGLTPELQGQQGQPVTVVAGAALHQQRGGLVDAMRRVGADYMDSPIAPTGKA